MPGDDPSLTPTRPSLEPERPRHRKPCQPSPSATLRVMSLWLDGAKHVYPPLESETTADVAVVGAGIAGIATAYFLAKGGARVVVLDSRGVAEAASGRNAGFLLAGVAENFVAASTRYGVANALRIWRLTKRTQTLVRELVGEHGIAC